MKISFYEIWELYFTLSDLIRRLLLDTITINDENSCSR